MMNNDTPIAPFFNLAHDIAYGDGGIDELPNLTLTDCIRAVGIMLSYDEVEGLTRDNADAVASALYLIAQAEAKDDAFFAREARD